MTVPKTDRHSDWSCVARLHLFPSAFLTIFDATDHLSGGLRGALQVECRNVNHRADFSGRIQPYWRPFPTIICRFKVSDLFTNRIIALILPNPDCLARGLLHSGGSATYERSRSAIARTEVEHEVSRSEAAVAMLGCSRLCCFCIRCGRVRNSIGYRGDRLKYGLCHSECHFYRLGSLRRWNGHIHHRWDYKLLLYWRDPHSRTHGYAAGSYQRAACFEFYNFCGVSYLGLRLGVRWAGVGKHELRRFG